MKRAAKRPPRFVFTARLNSNNLLYSHRASFNTNNDILYLIDMVIGG